MNKVLVLSLGISMALIMSSCGENDDNNENGYNEDEYNQDDFAKQKVAIYYIKRGENSISATEGISYICRDEDGDETRNSKTDKTGLFEYYDGDKCEFSLDGLNYGHFDSNTNTNTNLSFTYALSLSSATYSVEYLDGTILNNISGMKYSCSDKSNNTTIDGTTNDNGFSYYSGDKCEFKLPNSQYNFGYFYSEYEANFIYKMKDELEEDRFNSNELLY